jgi:type IV fimbrial biogenesis protein FimT
MVIRQQGLTLIELMVTLAVAIVLLAVGIPGFQSMIANHRAAALTNGVGSALTLARTEAMGRTVPVAVCPRVKDKNECAEDAAAWKNGWLVFTDVSGSGLSPTAEQLIRTFEEPTGNPAIGGSAMIRFGPDGMQRPRDPGDLAEIGMSVKESDASKAAARCLIVAVTGVVRTERKETCP